MVSLLPSITYVRNEITEMKMGAVIHRLSGGEINQMYHGIEGNMIPVEPYAVDTS
jgi:hypothetical protein